MSWFREFGRTQLAFDPSAAHPTVEEKRQATRSGVLGTGTLACPHCDAPVAPGATPLLLGDPLTCPFCEVRGPAREFLSLTAPSRPARVIVRVTHRGGY